MPTSFFEDKAEEFLRLKGYMILKRNFRSRFGEIDIIMKDDKTISFVEVKARNVNYMVSGLEAVDSNKQRKIKKTALYYVMNKGENQFYRFDVLEIIYDQFWRQYRLIKSAFE